MMNQWIKYLTGIFLILIFILAANLMPGLIFSSPPAARSPILPDLSESDSQSPRVTVSQSFPFENMVVNLLVPVNISFLEKTKPQGILTSPSKDGSGSIQIADIYRAMVSDPDQGQVFSDLINELRRVRQLQNLSDDEYLELTAVYVQSLRYEPLKQDFAKVPLRTVVDGAGDCDDKSLLLAGLLAREGYSVALLSFEPEAHMAVGVGSYDYRYKETGYAFIETTNYSFIGEPTDKLEGNLTLHSYPIIIIIGNGTKLYSSGNETQFIHDKYLITDQKLRELASKLKILNEDLMAKQSRLSEMESNLDQLRNSDNILEYNSHVSAYTTLLSIYNSRLTSYRQLLTEYEKYAVIHDYIFERRYDRKGVYDYIKKNLPD